MKRVLYAGFLVLTLAVFFASPALAACPDGSPGCDDPVFECPDGECDGGFGEAGGCDGTEGNYTENLDGSFLGTGGTQLEVYNTVGAPTDGRGTITSEASQLLENIQTHTDGQRGVNLQGITNLTLTSTAVDGGLEGARAFHEGNMEAAGTLTTTPDSLSTTTRTNMDMADMVCGTPGTTGSLVNESIAEVWQNADNGNGIRSSTLIRHHGLLEINLNPTP